MRSIRFCLMLAVLGSLMAPAGAGAQNTYVSTASCAWEQDTITVHVVPSAFVQAVGNEQDTIGIDIPGGPQGVVLLPGGAPTDTPWEAPYTRAAAEGVQRWATVAHAYAAANPSAAHLAALTIDVHVYGPETDPLTLPEPDVFVAFLPHMGTIAGANVFQSCESTSETTICDDNVCSVPIGSNILLSAQFIWSMTPEDIYNITMHEFGHVLGLDHVPLPEDDLMTAVYRYQPGVITNPQECLSTLNLEQAAENFRWLDGTTPYTNDPDPVFVPTDDYERFC